ncbi:hypothetical protein [Clostridium sp. ZS2-4]|uniref:hypothetical protein n=1 Tax=Clostridium sp. ZS2-4 TaxID=2987703 RepID=UPI00227A0F72|nr:hypothetical protein [Clostridium sp. ZS2-4]MCY6355223.1 hypothetical protein [Clostridium sp. ZS2-4]
MKKKLICSLLTAIVLLTPTATTFASINTNISKETVVEENSKNESKIKLNEREKQALSELNISEDDIIVLDKNSVFSNEDLKKIESAEAKDETDGFKKVEEITFQLKKSRRTRRSASHPDGIKRIDKVRLYVDGPTRMNTNKYGMRHWLNVGFTLTVGGISQKLGTAATILGINASDFLPTAIPGEALTKTHTKVYHDYYYKKYNPVQKIECIYVKTSSLEVKTTVDIYTKDKKNHPYTNRQETIKNFYTKHYGDGSWIYSEVNRRCSTNMQVYYIDQF